MQPEIPRKPKNRNPSAEPGEPSNKQPIKMNIHQSLPPEHLSGATKRRNHINQW